MIVGDSAVGNSLLVPPPLWAWQPVVDEKAQQNGRRDAQRHGGLLPARLNLVSRFQRRYADGLWGASLATMHANAGRQSDIAGQKRSRRAIAANRLRGTSSK
jgi:hypothetical protein